MKIPVRFLEAPPGSDFASDEDMPTGEIFVLVLIAIYIGWIAVAAVRSNRRHDANALLESQEAPTDIAQGTNPANHA